MRSKNIENEIKERLIPGSWLLKDLVESVSIAASVSPQGVYKAIRKLKASEVVSVYGKFVSLSGVWISKEREKLAFAEQVYKSSDDLKDLLSGKKERFSVSFKTLSEVDLFWTHAYIKFLDLVETNVHSCAIQPHDWYSYIRNETDEFWVQKHVNDGRLSRAVLTHSAGLDECVVRQRKEELGKLFEFTLNENPLKQKNTTYYSLLNPYIFTAEFDKKVATKLDDFIGRYNKLPLTIEAQTEISEIVEMKGNFRFTIEKSKKKAERMERKVKKYFEF